MKVFVSFDMEGVAGIVDRSQCLPPGQPYEEGRGLLLGEVNAAIDGALAAGATEIVCNDSHGAMNNLDPELLHGQATYVSGRHKPLYMMQGLEAGADVVFMVGYHGSISGESSILSHTYNPSVVSHVTLNGVRVGESGINALVALACGVPIGLITGDRQTAAEADPFLAGAERVVVKESFTRFGAVNQHPEVARARIAEAARRVVERVASLRPPAITLPAALEVHLQTADMAEVASWVRGAERTGVRTVTIGGDLKDFNYTSLHRDIEPLTMPYEPYASRYMSLKVKSGDLPGTIEAVHKIWSRLVPQRPFLYSFLDDDFNRQYQKDFNFRKLFTTFSCLAIFIACLGLLGLATYTAELRTKEIGIRKVLGANIKSILTLLSRDFVILITVAMVIATPVAWYAMNRWLEDFAYRVQIHFWIFILAGLVALTIAVLTISYQAIKSALVNPVNSLRSE